ncbi:hypothetical protein [Fodinibius sediminis]|uniref:Uncharacterized protein n=1 Tax=Fodinibius sediminis TaxID=1214077 RepID=A0A521AQ42_9BACT|nr:hypothetical protein [Fodinibius sediminis]SMO36953.1 hypothetical protein SAMN06265218_101276 [Fodinibius sediminis]
MRNFYPGIYGFDGPVTGEKQALHNYEQTDLQQQASKFFPNA